MTVVNLTVSNRHGFLLEYGQGEGECCASSVAVIFRPDPAPVRLDYALRYKQAQSCPLLGFRGEFAKQFGKDFRIDASPRIPDLHERERFVGIFFEATGFLRGDQNRALFCELDRVSQQVRNYFVDLYFVNLQIDGIRLRLKDDFALLCSSMPGLTLVASCSVYSAFLVLK